MTAPYEYTGLGIYSPKALSYSMSRKQVSQNGSGELGLMVVDRTSAPVDATGIELRIFLDTDFNADTTPDEAVEPVDGRLLMTFSGADIIRDDVGTYHVDIGPGVTKDRGDLRAVWSYTVGGTPLTYTDYLEITEYMPHYEALRPEEKAIVEQVSWMFADLFDSTNGGPNLQENFQTHYNFNRIAQLMHQAMIRINAYGVPLTNFGLGEGTTKLPVEFMGFLNMGTYLEVLRHFIRSYTEQPNLVAMSVTYTDRRDYAQRWRSVLDEEKGAFEDALKLAKRRLLGLGGGALLVGGGIYGGGGRAFYRSSYSMQVRSMRFYPYAGAILTVRR